MPPALLSLAQEWDPDMGKARGKGHRGGRNEVWTHTDAFRCPGLAKTAICRFWQMGNCLRGARAACMPNAAGSSRVRHSARAREIGKERREGEREREREGPSYDCTSDSTH